MSGPMVRAVLAGTKTQTRRIVKPQHIKFLTRGVVMPRDFASVASFTPHARVFEARMRQFNVILGTAVCPYGLPGDRLWVRESWRVVGWHDGEAIVVGFRDGTTLECVGDDIEMSEWDERMRMQSSDDCVAAGVPINGSDEYAFDDTHPLCTRWRPSIHMPRWASRLTLEVVSVRVERVQDISEADAQAEGAKRPVLSPGPNFGTFAGIELRGHPMTGYYRDGFRDLWESINGPESWDRNDWVWAVQFRRVQP